MKERREMVKEDLTFLLYWSYTRFARRTTGKGRNLIPEPIPSLGTKVISDQRPLLRSCACGEDRIIRQEIRRRLVMGGYVEGTSRGVVRGRSRNMPQHE